MRKKIDLNGEWRFQTDPLNTGLKSRWFTSELPDALNVQVPHIWQREGGDLVSYSGAAWYQREIGGLETNPNTRLHLCFSAIDYQCEIWWNGTYIGFHEGGFTPFHFEMPREVIGASNMLTVRVYDFPDNAEIPIGKQGSWYTRVSGIWQDVYLEERQDVYISNAFVTPLIDAEQVEIKLSLSQEAETTIQYTIKPHSFGEEEWKDGSIFRGEFERGSGIQLVNMPGMKLWSPSQPYLYELEISLNQNGSMDTYRTIFGCRRVEYKDGKVFLNHQPIYIRGALDQAFYPETIYTAPSVEYIKKEINLAKQMGFNLLRKHIKVELPEYLYWADRLGMLIWAEPPNYVKWTDMARKRFVSVLKEMIGRDFNHPSIIIWSIYNEEWGLEWDLEFDSEKQTHVAELFSEVKKMDPTRLICDNSGWTHVETDINDHHRYYVSPDQIDGWRHDLDEFVLGQKDKNFVSGFGAADQPILISEFGVWGLPDVDKLKEFYSGNEPWWFVNQGEETHQDEYKKPVTFYENFERFGIAAAFGNPTNLAKRSQQRMVRAVKSVIEEMRKRPGIAGYVVTEFTDIEWETNGWLDFHRQPKEGFDELVHFNGETCIIAGLPKHNYLSGERASWDLYLVSESLRGEAVIKWAVNVDSVRKVEGEIPVTLQSYVHLPNVVNLVMPETVSPIFAKLHMELWVDGEKVAVNNEELTILYGNNDTPPVYIQHSNTYLNKVITAAESMEDAAVIVSDQLDRVTLDYVRGGGKVLFLAEDGDLIPQKGDYTFRQLDLGESWARASSMNYLNPGWLEGLPVHAEMGWEFENLFPDYVVPFKDYKKVGRKRTVNMFGNPVLGETADIISGYFQGWLGQNGGSVLLQQHGEGVIMIVTWKLASQLENNPMAGLLIQHFVRKLAGSLLQTEKRQEV